MSRNFSQYMENKINNADTFGKKMSVAVTIGAIVTVLFFAIVLTLILIPTVFGWYGFLFDIALVAGMISTSIIISSMNQ